MHYPSPSEVRGVASRNSPYLNHWVTIMRRVCYSIPYSLKNGSGPFTLYGFYDSALVASRSNPFKNGHYISGGTFYKRERSYSLAQTYVKWRKVGITYECTPYFGRSSTTPPVPLTSAQLASNQTTAVNSAAAFGATAWKRMRPGNPVASVAVFTGELRDWLPHLPGKLYNALGSLLAGKQAAKRLGVPSRRTNPGDAYLNVMFGWAPLLSDIRKMYELYQTLDKRLAQIARDNGKGVYRRTTLRDTSTTTVAENRRDNTPFWGWAASPPGWAAGSGGVDTTTTTVDRIWACGKYRYYIPDIGSSEWTRRATRALYGANVTPEVIWELLPWSWLADWFGNIGDVISNASSNAVDNLTADYAYVMRTVETRITYHGYSTWLGQGSPDGETYIPAGNVSLTASEVTSEKMRAAASPFGFGVTFDSLSNYQLGIAAAFGISRWA